MKSIGEGGFFIMIAALSSLLFNFLNKILPLIFNKKEYFINKLFLFNFYQKINLRIVRFFYLLNIYYI